MSVRWNTRKLVGCFIIFYFLVDVSFISGEHYQNITEKKIYKKETKAVTMETQLLKNVVVNFFKK